MQRDLDRGEVDIGVVSEQKARLYNQDRWEHLSLGWAGVRDV